MSAPPDHGAVPIPPGRPDHALFRGLTRTAVDAAASPSATDGPPPENLATPAAPDDFNEAAYLDAFPDVAESVNAGLFRSGLEHFLRYGVEEGRLTHRLYQHALDALPPDPGAAACDLSIDACMLSSSGFVFIVGWVDDRRDPLASVSIQIDAVGWNSRSIARCRRLDVEAVVPTSSGHLFGFWSIYQVGARASRAQELIQGRRASGATGQMMVEVKPLSDAELRETVLDYFANAMYFSNRDIESFLMLDRGPGHDLLRLNKVVTDAIVARAHAEQYGPARGRFKASIIVCLYGRAEWMFLQNALFSAAENIEDYEFIYVSNSPELAEALDKEARIAALIYNLAITLVSLPDNAGFSAANNVAARFARSDRLVFLNPDVFPRDNGWVAAHEAILASHPEAATRLFGAPLYYDDGSLMHGGMYFEVDRALSIGPDEIRRHGQIRTEHYGKGAPSWLDTYTAPRPVPAITGAFISVDRAWFEALGGFSEAYLFGHYEDADLCLRSLMAGYPAWIHDVRFWHLEGKGGARRAAHDGGALVNRWFFTRTWGDLIEAEMVGQHPTHALLQPPAPLLTARPPATPREPVRLALVRGPSAEVETEDDPAAGLRRESHGA